MSKKTFMLSFVLFAAILSGCVSAQAPKLIGSFPAPQTESHYSPQPNVLYQTDLVLAVINPEIASRLAIRSANQHGGYVVHSSNWYTGGQMAVSLTLAVPNFEYQSFHDDLLRLGLLIHENQEGELTGAYSWNNPTTFSRINLELRPLAQIPSGFQISTWRPVQTLQNAIAILFTFFKFTGGLMICLLVVIAPFVLIGWLGYRAGKRKTAQG